MIIAMNIVVVEDHQNLQKLFVTHLNEEGFNAVGVSCAEELDDVVSEMLVHLLVLDINLPGENGFDIARRIRSLQPDINIIMLTARTREDDRIEGYESGADLYLPKPVSPLELTAAVRAVQRRLMAAGRKPDEITLNMIRMTISTKQGEIHLSKIDGHLLKALIMASGMVLPHWRFCEITKQEPTDLALGQIGVRLYRLRKKLTKIGIPETIIKSVRGEGYQLTLPICIEG